MIIVLQGFIVVYCLCLFEVVIANYDTLGWTQESGTSADDYAQSVVSLDGFTYVAGYTSGSLNGQPNAGEIY